jgi:exonuclease SbcC
LEATRAEIQTQLGRLEQRLTQLPLPEQATRVAAERAEAETLHLQKVQDAEAARTAWVRDKQDAETQRKNLHAQLADLEEQRRRLQAAGSEGNCPTCGRPLGSEFEGVVEVLASQIEDVVSQGKFYRQRIAQLTTEPAALLELVAERDRVEQEMRRLTELAAQLGQQVAERGRLEAERATLTAHSAELAATIAAAPERYDEARHAEVRRQIALLEPQADLAVWLRAAADRARDLVPRAAAAEQELSQRETQARALREQLTGLGWSAERFTQIRTRLREAERVVQQAEIAKVRAAGELTTALSQRAEVARRKEERERRALEVQRLTDELLLQHELDRALGDLRTELNNALRPDLSELASEFLRDLTTGRYSDLELDEDYVATIVEEGEPMRVISGGEEDVANLALRLAISQMIAERAGQPLSLLVLDEIFGSLDEERRVAVMDLLRNLADRFPQVILITHIESVREGFDRVIRLSYDLEQRTARAVLEPRDAAA